MCPSLLELATDKNKSIYHMIGEKVFFDPSKITHPRIHAEPAVPYEIKTVDNKSHHVKNPDQNHSLSLPNNLDIYLP